MTKPREQGFTLIEMSIVLVVIGLIVGGILVGQSLIAAAQMRSLMQQIERYKTAVMTFRGKYNCLPGDCANATTFFPADPGCHSDGVRPYLGTPNGLTCNGNGDGIINGDYDVERPLFFQHLSLAGLIPGTYTGTCGWASDNCTTNGYSWRGGLNVPAAVVNQSLNTMINIANPDIEYGGWSGVVQEGGQHVFWLSGTRDVDGSGNLIWQNAYMALTRSQLFTLDTKYDDGLPTSGYITVGSAFCGNVATQNMCFDGTQTPPAYYTSNVSSCGVSTPNVPACDAMFKAGF